MGRKSAVIGARDRRGGVVPTLDLRAVQAFVLVAEAGSFREAGARLWLDPSSVSKLVRRLEQDLGGHLFRRTTRSVDLTDFGAGVLQSSRVLLASLTDLRLQALELTSSAARLL